MTPSQTIVRGAHRTFTTVDKTGRRLLLRRLTALDTLRLFKAAGPVLSQNEVMALDGRFGLVGAGN